MISGTSKIWSKPGPVDLPIITKMSQNIQEQLWNPLGKIWFSSIWDAFFFGNFRNMYVLGTHDFCYFCRKWVHMLKIFWWRWGLINAKFPINKMYKSLDVNFISIKKMKWKFGKSSKLFYFQVRESPTNLLYFQVRDSPNFIFKEGNHPILNSR